MIALLAVILALTAPAVASAQGPGGTDEYVEQLPQAGGNNPSQSSADPETDEPLTPSQEEAVEEQGADGSAAIELAQATGPDGGGNSSQGGSGDGQSESDARSRLPAVVGDVASGSDDTDMGVLLPLVIGATLVAALAFVIIRRRRRQAAS
jgi:hypothetical protein